MGCMLMLLAVLVQLAGYWEMQLFQINQSVESWVVKSPPAACYISGPLQQRSITTASTPLTIRDQESRPESRLSQGGGSRPGSRAAQQQTHRQVEGWILWICCNIVVDIRWRPCSTMSSSSMSSMSTSSRVCSTASRTTRGSASPRTLVSTTQPSASFSSGVWGVWITGNIVNSLKGQNMKPVAEKVRKVANPPKVSHATRVSVNTDSLLAATIATPLISVCLVTWWKVDSSSFPCVIPGQPSSSSTGP